MYESIKQRRKKIWEKRVTPSRERRESGKNSSRAAFEFEYEKKIKQYEPTFLLPDCPHEQLAWGATIIWQVSKRIFIRTRGPEELGKERRKLMLFSRTCWVRLVPSSLRRFFPVMLVRFFSSCFRSISLLIILRLLRYGLLYIPRHVVIITNWMPLQGDVPAKERVNDLYCILPQRGRGMNYSWQSPSGRRDGWQKPVMDFFAGISNWR